MPKTHERTSIVIIFFKESLYRSFIRRPGFEFPSHNENPDFDTEKPIFLFQRPNIQDDMP